MIYISHYSSRTFRVRSFTKIDSRSLPCLKRSGVRPYLLSRRTPRDSTGGFHVIRITNCSPSYSLKGTKKGILPTEAIFIRRKNIHGLGHFFEISVEISTFLSIVFDRFVCLSDPIAPKTWDTNIMVRCPRLQRNDQQNIRFWLKLKSKLSFKVRN